MLVLAGMIAVWFLLPSTPASTNEPPSVFPGVDDPNYVPYPSTTQPGTAQSEAAVQSAFAATLAGDNPDNIKMENTVIAGDYALQVWAGTITGGQALLKYDTKQTNWTVLSMGGGSWTIESLTTIWGVPRATAVALVLGVSRR